MANYKSLGVFLFYGIIIALLAWGAYNTTLLTARVGKELGAFLGALLGVAISVGLWYAFGKKYVGQ